MNAIVPRTGVLSKAFPAILQRAGKAACFAADEFFSAKISNPHTRHAYTRPATIILSDPKSDTFCLDDVRNTTCLLYLPRER